MRVLYTSDGEPATVMDLETLVGNFNTTGGWQFRHNETDLRLELSARGWYEGLHDCGAYLVLNLDKFPLVEYRDPAMDDVDLFDDVLDVLAKNDGACLYWQMPDVARGKAAAASGAVRWSGDLLVHPDAVEIEPEHAFTMKKPFCQHRDDGRGRCIDCDEFI